MKYLLKLQPASDLDCTAMAYLSSTEPVDWVRIPCEEVFSGVNVVCSRGVKLEESRDAGTEVVSIAAP